MHLDGKIKSIIEDITEPQGKDRPAEGGHPRGHQGRCRADGCHARRSEPHYDPRGQGAQQGRCPPHRAGGH